MCFLRYSPIVTTSIQRYEKVTSPLSVDTSIWWKLPADREKVLSAVMWWGIAMTIPDKCSSTMLTYPR